MKFFISRESDEFMEDAARPSYPPVTGAVWDAESRRWTVTIASLESLAFIANFEDGVFLVNRDGEMHAIIRDLTPVGSVVANSNFI